MTILECFDLPRPTPNCLERKQSTVAPQALHLLNNQTIDKLTLSFADRVTREAGADLAEQIYKCYDLALSRSPTSAEEKLALQALGQLRKARSDSESGPRPQSPGGLVPYPDQLGRIHLHRLI